jgi:two-component system sensor histidine kinase YesM
MKNKMFLTIWRWWKQHNIREQIFLSMLLLTILAIGVLGTISYYTTNDSLERNYKESHETTLKNSSRVMNLNLKPIIEKTRAILTNANLPDLMSGELEYMGSEFTLTDQKRLENILDTIMMQEKSVSSAVLMDFYGHYFFQSNVNQGPYNFYSYYRDNDFQDEAWFMETQKAAGKEVFWATGVLGGMEKKEIICFTKLLNDPATGKPIGCMVVNLSRGLLRDSFVKGDEGYETSNYMIVDKKHNNKLVYIDAETGDNAEIMNAFVENPENSGYVFSTAENTVTGWSLVNVVTKNELSITGRSLRNIVLLWSAILAGLCFGIARIISRSITNPLKQLERTIYSVGEGARNITEEFDNSEVGRIGSKFKEMVNTSLELSERLMAARLNEREAELLLLQSQINPHFLYNTLDSIYCVAMIHGDDQIGEMVLALSENFKIALNNGEKYMTVSDSVKGIQGYMKLQNIRYHNRFELYVDVKREILQSKIISFILQPFVENAMYHGLEPKMGNGTIRLIGWREGLNILFEISDDGVGIQDMEKLEKGYGIRNVRERIQLNYGAKYGVTVKSEVGKGTTVRIVVPERPGRI